MRVKDDVSKMNIIALPIIYTCMSAMGFFAGCMTPLLLQSENYYNVPSGRIGRVTGNVLISA